MAQEMKLLANKMQQLQSDLTILGDLYAKVIIRNENLERELAQVRTVLADYVEREYGNE